MRAFWQWECDVQAWWVRVVRRAADVHGTDEATSLRMIRCGWRVLRLVTWPQMLARRVEFLLHPAD